MIKLYQFPASGNSHKIRLMLSLLDLKFKLENVDGGKRAHKSEAFLRMNPFGQVPVLVDGEFVLRDSQAILVYLAQRYGNGMWLPLDPENLAKVTMWLSTAANEVVRGPNLLRLHYRFGREIDVSAAQFATHQLLHIVNGCPFPRKSGGGEKAGTKYALWVGSRAGDSPAKRTLDAAHREQQSILVTKPLCDHVKQNWVDTNFRRHFSADLRRRQHSIS